MEIVTTIAPIALALIMLTLGLGLTIQDFTRVVNQPKDFIVGLLCQLILLPIVAFLLIKVLNTPLELALGVMIIAAAPGGVTSNVLTKFANGDVALSISLTAILSLISIISVPFIIFKSADLLNIQYATNEISMLQISLKMFLVVTLPVIIGMIIRKFVPFLSSEDKLMERISIFLFAIVFIAIWVEEKDNILSYLKQAGLVTLILNVVMMFIGYYIAKFLATGIEQRKCISLECGLQNGTLAVFVATQIFDDIAFIVPTATYALVMFLTSIIFVFLLRNTN
jgi:BASS family bile acid:Na+ symporter|tara:strand:+ start:94 stop:939 length:846 start_codon:yes stop_codon:yes gene_type:complete